MTRMSYDDFLFILQRIEEVLFGKAFATANFGGKFLEYSCMSLAMSNGKSSTCPNALDKTSEFYLTTLDITRHRSTSLHKVATCSRHFTRHKYGTLSIEMSRAFGRGLNFNSL